MAKVTPPNAVRPFYEQLCLEHFPCCGDLSYAVLALGDSSYEHFCKFGNDLDNKLASLGGVRLAERVDCDLDLDPSFARGRSPSTPASTKSLLPAPHAPHRLSSVTPRSPLQHQSPT